MRVKDVEILQPDREGSGASRIVEVARDASVSLVEDDGLLEILARVPHGTELPEEILKVAAEVLVWLHSHDCAEEAGRRSSSQESTSD